MVGGTGLLGGELVRAAAADGRRVAATFHASTPPDEATGVQWSGLDLRDPVATTAVVTDLAPTAVINAAYVQSGPDLEQITGIAPGVLAEASAATSARFVHVSSDVVFSGARFAPEKEADPTGPVTDYGRTKVRAELAVARADPRAAIVRTSLLWGGRDPGPQERLVTDPEISFYVNQVRCPLRVDRLAAALLEIAGRPEISAVLHVAGRDPVDRLTFARLLAPGLGVDPQTIHGTEDRRDDSPHHLVLDSSLARSLLETPLPGVRTDTA